MDNTELNNAKTQASHTRVLIFGYKEFSQLMSSVLGDYRHVADFKIVDAIVGSSFEIQQHINEFQPDVVVSAGSNARYLESALAMPVVSIETAETDILSAIENAAKVGRSVHVISFAKSSVAAELAGHKFGVDVEQTIYLTADQAREQFYIASQKEDLAIVGASLVCGLATNRDIPSFLVYSAQSCRQTLERALIEGREWRGKKDQHALVSWLLERSKTPIIMIDGGDESITLNAAAKQDLRLSQNMAVELDSLIHPEDGQRHSDGECEINGTEWWFHLDTQRYDLSTKYIYQLYQKRPKTAPQKTADKVDNRHQLVFQSKEIAGVMQQAKAFATSPSNVLLFGESGTGKELVARQIHRAGPYQTGKFVALNCSAIPSELFEGELFGHQDGAYTGSKRGGRKGLIEEAQNGALFLDEISELALDQQAKLLRFLQERSYRPLGGNQERDVDLKLIAASNRSLASMVEQGLFREDLFYRLNVFNISIPALRDRKDDILSIATQKLDSLVMRYQLSLTPQSIFTCIESALMAYHWPGNIRELENVLERIVAYLHTVNDVTRLTSALPQLAPELFSSPSLRQSDEGVLKHVEQESILASLNKWQGDKHKAAQELGISHTTLWRRLKAMKHNNN